VFAAGDSPERVAGESPPRDLPWASALAATASFSSGMTRSLIQALRLSVFMDFAFLFFRGRGGGATRQPRQCPVGTTGMLAPGDSAEGWKAKTSPKLTVKGMISGDSTAGSFMLTNNEKNELHEVSEISLGPR